MQVVFPKRRIRSKAVLVWLVSFFCLCRHGMVDATKTASSSTTAAATTAPWHGESSNSNEINNNIPNYQQLPPNIFAPRGRLHQVEHVMEGISSSEDPSANLIVALSCKDGLVVVSTVPPSVNFGYLLPSKENIDKSSGDDISAPKENNTSIANATTPEASPTQPKYSLYWNDDDDDDQTKDSNNNNNNNNNDIVLPIPFAENPNTFALTAGNAIHGRLLRRRIQNMAAALYESRDDGRTPSAIQKSPSVAILARQLADHCQRTTQTAGSKAGRMLVCSALMVGMEEGIWQVDPTGQFWNCHAAVVGRGSNKVRSYLLRQIAEKLTLQGETAKPSNDEEMKTATKAEKEDPAASVSSRDVQSYLSTLSVPEAVALAYQCCMVTAPRPEPSTSTEGLKKQPTDDISEPSERNNDTTSEATAKLKLPSAAPVLPDESTGSPRRLVAFSIQKNSHEKEGQVVRWYSEKDLRAHMSEDVAVP